MPEGVRAYPRWDGRLSNSSVIWTIVADELRRARRSNLTLLFVLLGLGLGLASVIELANFRADGDETHAWRGYLAMLNQLRWFALGAAAFMGGAALLEDHRRGALELYLTRPVTQTTYLVAKSLAVLILTTALMFLPSILYYATSLAFYQQHPEEWHTWALLGGLAISLAWAVLAVGLALGISSLSRSGLVAALGMLGGFVLLHMVSDQLLPALTENPQWSILSPFEAVKSMQSWLFPIDAPKAFPRLWGLIAWAGLSLAGWALMLWRHPQPRGVAHD
jgi:ABC-type transport system involved in multi-copper enzyme maturation permease subunit